MTLNPLRWFRRKRRARRGYGDLTHGRLLSDWVLSGDDANARISQHLGSLRNLARDMGETNRYARTFLDAVEKNVIGPDGFTFQSRVATARGRSDDRARRAIESRWRDWKRPVNATVAGCQHYNDFDRLAERARASDGECFLWVFPGHDNAHRFAVRLIEADQVDHELHRPVMRGSDNCVCMGVEVDGSGRPVAYWVDGRHPGAIHQSYGGRDRSRIPALGEYLRDGGGLSRVGYILHDFRARRPGQLRGVPELAPVVETFRHLDRAEEAEHYAFRIAACTGWQRIQEHSDDYDLNAEYQGYGDVMNVTPGFVLRNDPGQRWEAIKPEHPNNSLNDFKKTSLQSGGAALGLAYSTFGDLEGTSYSSGRTGLIAERDGWRVRQNETVNMRERPLFDAWLRTQLAFGLLAPYELDEEDRLREGYFQGRRWDWVDPLKDMMGKREELALRLTSPQRVAADLGRDMEEIAAEWEDYEALIASKNLTPTEFRQLDAEDIAALTLPQGEEPPYIADDEAASGAA